MNWKRRCVVFVLFAYKIQNSLQKNRMRPRIFVTFDVCVVYCNRVHLFWILFILYNYSVLAVWLCALYCTWHLLNVIYVFFFYHYLLPTTYSILSNHMCKIGSISLYTLSWMKKDKSNTFHTKNIKTPRLYLFHYTFSLSDDPYTVRNSFFCSFLKHFSHSLRWSKCRFSLFVVSCIG